VPVRARVAAAVLVGLAVVLCAVPAFAQCAMCQTALLNSAEGRGIGQEFNRAILVMLFAPYVVFGSVGAVLLRHRIRAALVRAFPRLAARRPGTVAPSAPSQVH
jgi:hypothetical protein